MEIQDYENGKMVSLSAAFDNRSKVLNGFYFVLFFGAFLSFLYMLLRSSPDSGLFVFTLLMVIAFFIAAYRFGKKAVYSEKLFITKGIIQHIQSGFTKKIDEYKVDKITNFRHLDKPVLTDHPLAGKSFDYLGFQTEQKVINEMHGDKRLAFDYNGRTIKFGENIYSWDFGELSVLLYEITGNDLRYAGDHEMTRFPKR